MPIEQRSIVELPFNLPQGILNHPAIVISSNYANEQDSILIAVMMTNNRNEDDFTFRLTPQMFTGNNLPTSYQARLHLVSMFNAETDIIINNHRNVKMKEAYFNRLMDRIIRVTFGLHLNLQQ